MQNLVSIVDIEKPVALVQGGSFNVNSMISMEAPWS